MKFCKWIFQFIKSDSLRKPFILHYFKKQTTSSNMIDMLNRFIMSNISSSDYIGEISEIEEKFLCLYNPINEKDITSILDVMVMAYYTELIKQHRFEIKMVDKNSLSLFKRGKIKLIKHDEKLKNRYISKVKDL
jgi:hypothetical protein